MASIALLALALPAYFGRAGYRTLGVKMSLDIGGYGNITVMLPAGLVLAGWLAYCASRRAAMGWLVTMLVAYTLVAGSKVLFKGWGIGVHRLDIAVLSGHAMNTCMVVTAALSLLARQLHPALRWAGAALGTAFGWWFAVNCVAPFIHPLPEALAGALVGSIAAWLFLRWLEQHEVRRVSPAAIAFGLVVIAACGAFPKYTAEHFLDQFAIALSGAEKPFSSPAQQRPTL